jgi:hypothetical protein
LTRIASQLEASASEEIAVHNYLLEHRYVAARERAFQLADTGRFRSWPELAAALALEGHGNFEVERLAADRSGQVLLTLRLLAGRESREER